MELIIIAILAILLLISCYVNYNTYKKIAVYEKYIKIYNDVFLDFVRRLKATDEQLKIIDARGTFQSDDEVGFFFTELKKIQILMNEFIENVQTLKMFK